MSLYNHSFQPGLGTIGGDDSVHDGVAQSVPLCTRPLCRVYLRTDGTYGFVHKLGDASPFCDVIDSVGSADTPDDPHLWTSTHWRAAIEEMRPPTPAELEIAALRLSPSTIHPLPQSAATFTRLVATIRELPADLQELQATQLNDAAVLLAEGEGKTIAERRIGAFCARRKDDFKLFEPAGAAICWAPHYFAKVRSGYEHFVAALPANALVPRLATILLKTAEFPKHVDEVCDLRTIYVKGYLLSTLALFNPVRFAAPESTFWSKLFDGTMSGYYRLTVLSKENMRRETESRRESRSRWVAAPSDGSSLGRRGRSPAGPLRNVRRAVGDSTPRPVASAPPPALTSQTPVWHTECAKCKTPVPTTAGGRSLMKYCVSCRRR